MPLDAVLLSSLNEEIAGKVIGAKIDKVFQPEKDEIILHLRTSREATGEGRENIRLLFSASPNNARIHFSTEQKENPQVPPMFCMLLRKHLVGGTISSVTQPTLERMLDFEITTLDEMGELSSKRLIIELIGRGSNVIALDSEGRILDSLRRVDSDISSARQVLPGMFYRPPMAQVKTNPLNITREQIEYLIESAPADSRIDKWIIDSFFGMSPLIAREISHLCTGTTSFRLSQLSAPKKAELIDLLTELFDTIKYNKTKPYMLINGDTPYDISYIPITQYGDKYKQTERDTFNELVEDFYFTRDRNVRIKQRTQHMNKLISSTLERVRRKVENQKLELAAAKERERIRELGEIIMANLHNIRRGQRTADLEDFYDPEGKTVTVELDPRLSPQQNAAKHYKDYNRMKNAEKILGDQIASGESEAIYLESVLDMLARAITDRDIQDIREELQDTGYLRKDTKHQRKNQKEQPPREFKSSGGFTILVGRNNIQNDKLTFKEARRDDIWFHVQGYHGSHVIIRCEGKEPDDATYTEAAAIAAYYSEARGGNNVPVDYTRIRHVKKPPGARPGMVIYDPYFTAYVKHGDSPLV